MCTDAPRFDVRTSVLYGCMRCLWISMDEVGWTALREVEGGCFVDEGV